MSTDDWSSTLCSDLMTLINTEITLDPSSPVGADTDLLLTGLVDSLGVVQLVGWLEDRLGVEIDPIDVVLENFQTVEQMVAFAQRLGPHRDGVGTSAR